MTTIDSHKYQLNQINLYGGDVKLFTTLKSNGIWYVKIYIHEEKKYFHLEKMDLLEHEEKKIVLDLLYSEF